MPLPIYLYAPHERRGKELNFAGRYRLLIFGKNNAVLRQKHDMLIKDQRKSFGQNTQKIGKENGRRNLELQDKRWRT